MFTNRPASARRRKHNHHEEPWRLGAELMERRCMLAAGVFVGPVTGLTTSETGGSVTIRIRLTTQPTADVTIPISSSDASEGTLNQSQVVFTPANWNVFQTVRVTGQPDGIRDGNQRYALVTGNASSTDPTYSGLSVRDIGIVNRDSQTLVAGATVRKTSGLMTTEDGGKAMFFVRLNYKPTANVNIPIASDNPREGVTDVTQLVFTPANYATDQAVVVTGQPDGVKDGMQTYHIVTGPAVSDDPLYGGLAIADVTVRNQDSKTLIAKIKVAPLVGQTSELGGTASFTMVLGYKPTADVVIPMSSTNPSAGLPNVSSVTFTPANWNMPQTVVVTGKDDGVFTGDIFYKIVTDAAISADPLYSGMNAADFLIRNRHRSDIDRFSGTYTGWFSGTVTIGGISSALPRIPLAATIQNGIVQVTTGGVGGGRITATGALGFALTSGNVSGGSFSGRLLGIPGTTQAVATGTWSYLNGLLGKLRVTMRGRFEVRCPTVAVAVRG